MIRAFVARARRASLLVSLPVLASCGSPAAESDTTFPEAPLSTLLMPCGQADVTLALRTAPTQPPTAGLDGVEVVLTDSKTGAPVDGATIALVPWMPLMGHGADLDPIVTPKGKGKYVLTNVNLYMPGEWQLRFQISSSAGPCSASPTFDVP